MLEVLESRVNGAHFDVAESDVSVGIVLMEIIRISTVGRAGSSEHPRSGRITVGGQKAVQPQHVVAVVIPEGEDQHHASLERVSHDFQTSHISEVVDISVQVSGLGAVVISYGVESIHVRPLGY